MTFIDVQDAIQSLETRRDKAKEGLCNKNLNEIDTAFERGRVAELKTTINTLKEMAAKAV